MSRVNSYIKYLLIILIGFLFVKNIIFIQHQQLWSPIDEYAHMDYVIKLSEGQIPKLSDRLSPEIIHHIQTVPEKNLHKNLVDVNQLGFAGFSYEAHHPPLYYVLLAVPNTILTWLNVDLFSKLKSLRLFSFLLYSIGLFLVIPIFKRLKLTSKKLPITYALGCIVFGLLIATHQRYGLGNNMLSPLLVNLTVLFLLKAFETRFKINFILSILFGCLSIFTSYTNIFIIPFLYIFSIITIIQHIRLKTILWSISIIFISFVFFLFWRSQSTGDKNIEKFIYLMLDMLIPAGFLTYRYFIEIFLADSFTLTFIKPGLSFTRVYCILLGVNGIVSLFFIKSLFQKHKWIIAAYMFAAIFLLSTFLLNKYVGGVNWYALRHFMGFIPIFYICCTAFILLLNNKMKK